MAQDQPVQKYQPHPYLHSATKAALEKFDAEWKKGSHTMQSKIFKASSEKHEDASSLPIMTL